MKIEEATETITKFFNDLIGAWVPSTVLAIGLAVMQLGPVQLQSVFKLGDSTSAALTFAGILFAIGHALLACHEQVLKKMLAQSKIAKTFDEAEAKKRQSYERFAELVKAQQTGIGAKDWGYYDLRSVALAEAACIQRSHCRCRFIRADHCHHTPFRPQVQGVVAQTSPTLAASVPPH
jgi:hypothetical protein